MAIYKRNKTWWIDYTSANGERIRQSTGTQDKRKAQELHDRLKTQSWDEAKLGARPRYTWQQAVVRWCDEMAHKKSLRCDILHFRYLDPHFGHLALCDINKELVNKVKHLKKESGVKNASVNRMLALIRSVLNRAKNEWEWIDSIPKISLLSEPQKRVKYLSEIEAQKLSAQLPAHLKSMFWFTLATGLRESNVTGLEWSQIDLQRRCAWINADQSKSGKSIAVPLNNDALAIIKAQIGNHNVRVFTYENNPVSRANNHAWRKALKRAGIEDFRWHDLRHTWASWHVQNGTPLHALQELGGWHNGEMVKRYAHLSPKHLADFADNVLTHKKIETNTVVQIRHKQ